MDDYWYHTIKDVSGNKKKKMQNVQTLCAPTGNFRVDAEGFIRAFHVHTSRSERRTPESTGMLHSTCLGPLIFGL
jgi:hypothetical protein